MVVGHGVAPCVSCVSCRRVHWLTRRRNRDGWICTTDARRAARLQRAALLLFAQRPEGARRALPSHALEAAPSPRCRAPSATSRTMDLPRGRAPRCPRYQRGASLSTLWQNKVVPAARRKRSPGCGLPADPLAVPVPPGRLREWGFLSELHRPNAAYDTAASAARPRNRKMWTAPDVRRVLPIKSRVHRCLCLRSERCGRRDLHAHATVGSEF